jgi:hypothetical protein
MKNSTARRQSNLVYLVTGLLAAGSVAYGQSPAPPVLREGGRPSIRRLYGSEPAPAEKVAPALVFLLNFPDFNCNPCLENFLDFCDMLRYQQKKIGKRDVVLLFEKDSVRGELQRKQLARWLKKLRIAYPFLTIERSEFEKCGLLPSCAVVLEGEKIGMVSHLPFPREEKAKIIEMLTR